MTIAIIGWGSLIWCPGSLNIRSKWRSDGPELPIEFARISRDGRLTLVILPGAEPQRTYWALSGFDAVKDAVKKARADLRQREGCELADIHYLGAATGSAVGVAGEVRKSISDWLAARKEVDAAIWTGLSTNWFQKRGREFSLEDAEDAVLYLKELEAERDRAAVTYDRAREYIRNAPSQVQTKVRRRAQELGWRDAVLPKVLFEE